MTCTVPCAWLYLCSLSPGCDMPKQRSAALVMLMLCDDSFVIPGCAHAQQVKVWQAAEPFVSGGCTAPSNTPHSSWIKTDLTPQRTLTPHGPSWGHHLCLYLSTTCHPQPPHRAHHRALCHTGWGGKEFKILFSNNFSWAGVQICFALLHREPLVNFKLSLGKLCRGFMVVLAQIVNSAQD